MFCATLPCLVGVAVIFAGISNVAYIPLMEGVVDTYQARVISTFARVVRIVGGVAESLGLETPDNVARAMTDFILSDNTPPPPTDHLKVEDYTFDGVPVRLYRPTAAAKPSPSVIYLHGGGWTILHIDSFDDILSDYAVTSGYVFISIEYPLAPENPFPKPFETCLTAVLHVLSQAGSYGLDAEKVAIAGDSAGGNLAAAVSLKLSELKDVPKLRFQWLIYPALQAFTFKTPSYLSKEDASPYFNDGATMAHYWCNYMGINTPRMKEAFRTNHHTSRKLKQSIYASYVDSKLLPKEFRGDRPGETRLDYGDDEISNEVEKIILNPYFAPLMAPDLSGVAPAFVVTAEFDVLRDDGLMYAQRMKDAGVDVVVYNSPGSIHGFLSFFEGLIPKYTDTDHTIGKFVKYAREHFK
ncbi:carboxylesterase NlhH-like [Haliotis rubra]|uniref:carboxylesterase NlhH-like n=1 Tax=Haliotis rubra TaxID=36100 RepID=UPI001EE58389|nr:carboxylesterase NlhH-like [Haliotis rubra]XP_046565355.1 carboxylesterase NlhH-like [Haliotis rubra]